MAMNLNGKMVELNSRTIYKGTVAVITYVWDSYYNLSPLKVYRKNVEVDIDELPTYAFPRTAFKYYNPPKMNRNGANS